MNEITRGCRCFPLQPRRCESCREFLASLRARRAEIRDRMRADVGAPSIRELRKNMQTLRDARVAFEREFGPLAPVSVYEPTETDLLAKIARPNPFTDELSDLVGEAVALAFDARQLCQKVLELPLDDDLREQVQRAADLLFEARDSLEFVHINAEDESA